MRNPFVFSLCLAFYTYTCKMDYMKKKDLCKALMKHGWWKYDEGPNHEKWTNGEQKTTVPRHREINELTARGILRLAKTN